MKIQEALSEKVGQVLEFSSLCISGFVIAFIYGWKMSFVLTSITPLIIASGSLHDVRFY